MSNAPLWSALPDAPGFPASAYAPLADAIARILGTTNPVLLIQGEAVVALEASAASLGRPGLRALNIVTSMYGRWFGHWLSRAGAEVVDLEAEPSLPIEAEAVAKALETGRFDLVAVVHAESAYGILNPLPEIAALTRAHGALLVVDAVASVGGHELEVDALGIDIAVIGPQKSLGGQAGVSALSLSPRAAERLNPPGPAPSILSLADQKTLWLDQGRGALPGTPSALEFHALAATLAKVEAEGLANLQARHRTSAAMARAGVAALVGAERLPSAKASNLVTSLPLPAGLTAPQLLAHAAPGHALSSGVGPKGETMIRLTHTGRSARPESVLGDLATIGAALLASGVKTDPGAALAAALAAQR